MTIQNIKSYAAGEWISCDAEAREIKSAVTGDVIARAGNSNLDVDGMLDYGRTIGSAALQAMTFHERAKMIKALAL